MYRLAWVRGETICSCDCFARGDFPRHYFARPREIVRVDSLDSVLVGSYDVRWLLTYSGTPR
jgi:hypothetical protein